MTEPRVVLRSLALRDFRNLGRLDVALPDEGVAIVGENGQGKTNLLEAVYYLHLLRSARGARDVDIVRFGAPGFHIGARAEGGAQHELSVGFERTGRRKRVKLDGAEPARLSDALGALPCVLFSPADVELVAGAPSASLSRAGSAPSSFTRFRRPARSKPTDSSCCAPPSARAPM